MGNRLMLIDSAIEGLMYSVGKILAVSGCYESDAWGFEADQQFINRAVCLETELMPDELLSRIQEIEASLGRVRTRKGGYESRTIDIDILFYGNQVISTARLRVPHPLLAERRFALLPLHEIAPNLVHPLNKHTISELLENCPDNAYVKQVYYE